MELKMRDFLFKFATPLTAGLFLVSTVSGVALFLGWQPGLFHEMHEVLSLVLIAPVAVHLWRNWKPLLAYFRRSAMPVALAASVAAAGFYVYEGLSSTRGPNPAFALMSAAQRAPVSQLAPVLGLDASDLARRLEEAGYGAVAATDTVEAIAARNGAETMAVMARLTAPAT
jgi:hypothetical protein